MVSITSPKSPVREGMMSSPAADNLEQLDLFQPQEYTLGLDLGIKSIGWAVLHRD